MPSFRQGTVPVSEAARAVAPGQVSQPLLSHLKKMQQRVDNLETKVGGGSVDFNKRAPVAPIAPRAKFFVQPVSGTFTVAITNPQDVTSRGTAKNNVQNPARTPILHRIAFSLTPEFDADGDVRYYGPSTQTHFPVVDIGVSNRYVRLQSSFDGENWNQASTQGPFQS